MSQSHVTPTALPERATARPAGWSGGRIAALVIGALLVLLSLGLIGGGGTGVWALFQRDGSYVTTDVHHFSTGGAVLTTDPVHLGSSGTGWLYSSTLLGKIRIRVTPESSGQPLFVAIGPSGAVDGYLAGVNRTLISDFWSNDVQNIAGGNAISPPGQQNFWVASSSGQGTRNLVWNTSSGKWTVVVMNADGHPGINVGSDLGAEIPALPWITLGLMVTGVIFMAGGAFLIVVAIRRKERTYAEHH